MLAQGHHRDPVVKGLRFNKRVGQQFVCLISSMPALGGFTGD